MIRWFLGLFFGPQQVKVSVCEEVFCPQSLKGYLSMYFPAGVVLYNFRGLMQVVGESGFPGNRMVTIGLEGDTVKMKILEVSTCRMWLVKKHHASKEQTRSRLSFW